MRSVFLLFRKDILCAFSAFRQKGRRRDVAGWISTILLLAGIFAAFVYAFYVFAESYRSITFDTPEAEADRVYELLTFSVGAVLVVQGLIGVKKIYDALTDVKDQNVLICQPVRAEHIYLYKIVRIYWAQLLSAVLILVPFGGMILAALDAAEVHKSYKYQMWEIEASCANSLREVMLQRLLLSGGITTFILMLLAAFASVQLRISLIQLLSFFLSPFLLVTGSYLYLLRHLRGRMNEMILLAAVILCGMGLMLGLEFLELYTESMLLFSVAVFIVMLLFALRELKRCFSRKERHEWN